MLPTAENDEKTIFTVDKCAKARYHTSIPNLREREVSRRRLAKRTADGGIAVQEHLPNGLSRAFLN